MKNKTTPMLRGLCPECGPITSWSVDGECGECGNFASIQVRHVKDLKEEKSISYVNGFILGVVVGIVTTFIWYLF